MEMNSSFVYRDRGIRSCSLNMDGQGVHTFQDQMLMAEEASTFLKMWGDRETHREIPSNSEKRDKRLGNNIFPKNL